MKKFLNLLVTIFSVVLLTSSLSANQFLSVKDSMNTTQKLQWTQSYSRALSLAKQQNKVIMYVVSKDGCKWCDRFKAGTLTYDMIVRKLNKDFIVVEGYANRGEVPRHLLTSGTPATWFLLNDGEPMFQPIMGAMDAQRFDTALDTVLKEYATLSTAKKGKIATH